MTDYKITIAPREFTEGIMATCFSDGMRLVAYFDDVADLDHFIYQLRQASFDFKINKDNGKGK